MPSILRTLNAAPAALAAERPRDMYPAHAASLMIYCAWYAMSGVLISTVKRARMRRISVFSGVCLGLSAFAFRFNYAPFSI